MSSSALKSKVGESFLRAWPQKFRRFVQRVSRAAPSLILSILLILSEDLQLHLDHVDKRIEIFLTPDVEAGSILQKRSDIFARCLEVYCRNALPKRGNERFARRKVDFGGELLAPLHKVPRAALHTASHALHKPTSSRPRVRG